MKPGTLSREECAALLSAGRYGRLGLSICNLPYVIPISYVYFENSIYFHSSGRGKKVQMVNKNPHICFEVDFLDKGCWSSVVVYGLARLSTQLDAKRRMFDAFTRKGLSGHGGKHFMREDLENMDMTIWEIAIKEMTGRVGIW
ncbi:MAG: pyridoxamine 5'-phosphate oxidase [Peptococcaceae bacterium BICA1-7]|nr:MAG: pyridoxamine 5'-phosphate oxidase [Peptococcaceae bacterium BICA1-7]HBV96109.1 pyridoxamine 5'-phosphate oxidase family protein [Desulfotomaculum sp.]